MDMRNAYNTTVGKPKQKGLIGRPRRRCEDNSDVDVRRFAKHRTQFQHGFILYDS
jgi:hypothetical protein